MLRYGLVLLVCSCVDNNYDLNKEIATDVRIEGNRVSVPFGNMKAVTLDSLIDVDDVEILEKSADGTYSISVEESISPVEETVDPVKLNIDPQEHTVNIEFESVDIDTVHIEAQPIKPIVFNTPDISLEGLNNELPVLKSSAVTKISNEDIEYVFRMLESDKSFNTTVSLDEKVTTGTQYVDCDFSYELPDEVETINSIRLKTPGTQGTSDGALVEVVMTNSKVLNTLDKLVDFRITFPKCIELYTDKYELSSAKNEISVKDLRLDGEKNIIRFYIKEMKDVDKRVNGNGIVDFAEEITYTLDYKVSGNLNVDSKLKREDLDFNVSFNVPLAFEDAKGKTKELEVGFEPIVMDFSAHFDDLEYIDTIYHIEFEKERSMLQFESLMDISWLKDFELKKGHALKIDFPEELFISDEFFTYKGKGKDVIYDKEKHAFYVYDLQALGNTRWNLALERFDVNLPVVDEECNLDVKAHICFVDENDLNTENMVLAEAELHSMVSTLDKLKGEKSADFNMISSDLVIKDAEVHTEVIKSELDTETDFTFNNDVPEEIGRLEKMDFVKNGTVTFDMNVSGLDELDETVHVDLYALMPSFLKLQNMPERSADVNLDIVDDTLFIKTDINPHGESRITFALACTGIDFMTEEFGYKGMEPKDSTDGKSYISYEGNIFIYGDAYIDGVEMHSNVLDKLNDIVFDVNVNIDEMQVKTFHGLYRGELDEVEESFDLDLGEELEFLKEDGNSITLAEPQIEIVLENSIGVPIDVDMEIFGKDDNGNVIKSSIIKQRVSVKPASYNEESGEITAVETRLFLTSDSNKVAKMGYKNIQVPELVRLLEKIPNTIDFKIKPTVNTQQTHHINIVEALTFSGSYSVYIPLKFDNLNILYNDTIDDLIDSFGENLDMLTNIRLDARMDIVNTIPLGLQLSMKALDMNGETIETIEVEPVFVKAGLGGKIAGSDQEAQKVILAIKSATGDFSTLDKLALEINAASDHTTGASSLNAEQGISISNIVLDIVGDIETDLDD